MSTAEEKRIKKRGKGLPGSVGKRRTSLVQNDAMHRGRSQKTRIGLSHAKSAIAKKKSKVGGGALRTLKKHHGPMEGKKERL